MFYNDFTLNYFKDLKYSGSLINPTHKAMIGSVKQEAIVNHLGLKFEASWLGLSIKVI